MIHGLHMLFTICNLFYYEKITSVRKSSRVTISIYEYDTRLSARSSVRYYVDKKQETIRNNHHGDADK